MTSAPDPILAQPLPGAPREPSERLIVFLIGAVQFVNILDFVMVMPLGPDFARDLHIPMSNVGVIGGSYTAAAAVSGLLGSFFLDRFDRRRALGLAMIGLVIGTAAGGFATGLGSLVAARIVAGAFGGPATSLAFSIIADVVPNQRRGKAMGAVMSAFAVASVLGVPAGLWLAAWSGWRTPFFVVAGLGLTVAVSAVFALPPMRRHLAAGGAAPPTVGLVELLKRPEAQLSYLMTATVMAGGFILIPNISAYVQQNLGFPREHLGLLYLVGGFISFFTTRAVGWLVDRFGSFAIGTAGTALLAGVIFIGFASYRDGVGLPWLVGGHVDATRVGVARFWAELPVFVIFAAFMLAMGFRNVSYNTLTSKVPGTGERARFMSIQSAVQHFSSATGAFLSSHLLGELPDGKLVGIPRVATVSICLCAVLPLLFWAVERRVRRREQAAGDRPPPELQRGINAPGPGMPRP